MLILSRRQEESIVIGDDIILKVVSIDRGSVKLGFDAPPRTMILRAELKEAIQRENRKATTVIEGDVLSRLGSRLKLSELGD